MKGMPKTMTPIEALETAYWLNWVGDNIYARKLLIRIADFVCDEEKNGQKQKLSLWE